MIILGIDPGSRITGFGLVKKIGNRNVHVENGSLYLKDTDTFPKRLVMLNSELNNIITKFKPDMLVVENIFYHKNPKSIQKLGEVRGVVILTAAMAGLPVYEYTPLEIKKAVTGFGSATKEQMQFMVRRLLALPDLAEENASDALGIALCHANTQKTQTAGSKIERATLNPRQEILKRTSFYR